MGGAKRSVALDSLDKIPFSGFSRNITSSRGPSNTGGVAVVIAGRYRPLSLSDTLPVRLGMSILPLPEGTVRQLGSTLVIVDPTLLLKELLDNALDSGATSIDVLVSPNTVDKIEVRDNGHGISPDDFGFLGCPGHTSKLRSFNELGTVGGSTLGFRGAALASANALADISLTTRVTTEHVAAVISLAKGGGVGTRRPAAAPVGTTIRATGLFMHLPVRLQVAIREAPRSLGRMKDLLRSYALARPGVRLRFAVLKNPNLSWSYAPALDGDVKNAAMQLFGTDLASQCTLAVFPSERSQENAEPTRIQNSLSSSPEREAGPIFEALLPRPGADSRKIAKGTFLSVDSRPISSARGTARKLISLFRTHLGRHLARVRPEDTPKDPFIRLNIRCLPGSYDVNVEPSKDDVIFKDEQHLLDQFEAFLLLIYSTPEPHASLPPPLAKVEAHTDSPIGVAAEILDHHLPSQVWRRLIVRERFLLKYLGRGSIVES